MEFLGGLEDVLDDTREAILENRMMLNAKKAVLIQESKMNRFSGGEKLNEAQKQEAMDYAKAVARMQLEVKDMQEQLLKDETQVIT